jgi:hypothetical protein
MNGMTDAVTKEQWRQAKLDALEWEVDNFQWGYGNWVRGEVSLNREEMKLELVVFCEDNDNLDQDGNTLPSSLGEDGFPVPLIVTHGVRLGMDPKQQIRELIHWHLCHEADEQMWFKDRDEGYVSQPFYPHNPDGSLREV